MSPAVWLITVTLAQSPAQTAPTQASTDRWPDSRPITHIFQNLVSDIAHLPSKTSFETLIAGSTGAAIIGTVDTDVANWAGRQPSASYTKIGDKLGLGVTQAAAAIGTYAIGKIAHQPATTHIGGDLIRVQLLNGLITSVVKVSVDRTRPNGAKYSFPSGHSSATFASAAVLGQHFGWKVAIPAYATASFVGWTRIRDHVHYPSDVVFGATIGVIAGQTVTHGHREWTVMPVKTGGGLAVYVVRTK